MYLIFYTVILIALYCIERCQPIKLNCEDIRAFVDGHNNVRLLLQQGKVPNQPRARNIKLMIWDEELAEKARKWVEANPHKMRHNPNQAIASKRFKTGENMFMLTTNGSPDPYKIANASGRAWFGENKYYNYGKLSHKDFNTQHQIGHYTQMIWADSKYLGCGISIASDKNWKSRFMIACNYGPAGNMLGSLPYESTTQNDVNSLIRDKDSDKVYGKKC